MCIAPGELVSFYVSRYARQIFIKDLGYLWDLYEVTDLMKMYHWQLQATDDVPDGYEYLDNCNTGGWTELCAHFG